MPRKTKRPLLAKKKKGLKAKLGKKVGTFYCWHVVILVVIVIVAIAGGGFYAWHSTPSFCGTICHQPQDPYNPTYYAKLGQSTTDKWGNEVKDAQGMLAPLHRAKAGATCLSCHEPTLKEQISEGVEWVTGNFYNPLSERSLDNLERWKDDTEGYQLCLNESCHNMDKSELTAVTSGYVRNPHSWHHSEYTCSDCHKSHRASIMVCKKCHDDAEVPTGWITPTEASNLKYQQLSYDLETVVYDD